MTAETVFVSVEVDVDPLAITVPNDKQGEKHMCEICGLSFSQDSCILKHKKEVHFKVKECKVLLSKLEVHRCDLCGLSFVQKSSLFTHKYIAHTRIKECRVMLPKINEEHEKYEINANEAPKQKDRRMLRARDYRITYVETEEK